MAGTAVKKLQLNDETMWGGSPYRNREAGALKSVKLKPGALIGEKTWRA